MEVNPSDASFGLMTVLYVPSRVVRDTFIFARMGSRLKYS